jgi:hypothetical protein
MEEINLKMEETEDNYIIEKVRLIFKAYESADIAQKMIEIVNKIYQDGYEDGANSK